MIFNKHCPVYKWKKGQIFLSILLGEELSKKVSLCVDGGIDLSWKKERKARTVC